MLRILLGADVYTAGCTLYFERHDGQACTIEDWLACFEEVAGVDLSQFKRWYSQAGTPKVTARWGREEDDFVLHLSQEVPPTPDQPLKEPAVIPVLLALYSSGEEVVPETLHVLDGPELRLSWPASEVGTGEITPSLLRGFSAPVILDAPTGFGDRLALMRDDSDPFNRWEAGRSVMREALLEVIKGREVADPALFEALEVVLSDASVDPAYRALMFALPSEDDLAQACVDAGMVPDPSVIHAKRQDMQRQIAAAMAPELESQFEACTPQGAYSPDAEQAAQRSLRNTCLAYLTRIEGPARARALYDAASNMTDQIAAFACLLEAGDAAVAGEFETQWKDDRLVMDKWFMVQVAHAAPDDAVSAAEGLCAHPLFDWKNPNRFRSVVGGLSAGNPAGFHAASGAGYRFLADWLIKLDGLNPQTAARMSTAFETWKRYDADRQALMRAELDRIAANEGLSRDLGEMVARMRAG